MSQSSPGAVSSGEIKIWDPLVRLFHWSLAAAFAVAFVTGDFAEGENEHGRGGAESFGAESFGMELHENAGYVMLGLVVFRVIWGVIGTRHARFGDFVTGPAAVSAYLIDMARRKAKRYLGHNPAGGAMVVALLVMVAVTSGSGVLMIASPLKGVHALGEFHEVCANATLALVVVHVIGVVVASIEHKESLVKAMITGRKRADRETDAS